MSYSNMYESGGIPVVDYGSAIWGSVKHKQSKLIQNRIIYYFLGEHKFTAIPALHGEIGWLSVKHRIHVNKLCQWDRLVNMPQERLTKQIFLGCIIVMNLIGVEHYTIYNCIRLHCS